MADRLERDAGGGHSRGDHRRALGDMPLVRTDDSEAFHRIVSSHRRSITGPETLVPEGPGALTGRAERGESAQDGLQDACRDLGIPGEDIRIWRETGRPPPGKRRPGRFSSSGGGRPDALICANDDMALGAMRRCGRPEIRVPEDLVVTGFDGIFSASSSTPRLATVDRNFQRVGYRAMETVLRMIEGETQPPVVYNAMRERLTGTCGCRRDEQAEVIRIKDRFFRQTQFLRRFYLTQDKFATAIFSSEPLRT